MSRFKTFDNSQVNPTGLILPSDLNEIQDAYEEAFSTWKPITRATRIGTLSTTVAYANGTDPLVDAFALDANDFATAIGTARAAQFRVKAVVSINDVAPACDVQVGLVRVTNVGAASGSSPTGTATANAIDPTGADAAKAVTPAADSITVVAGNAVAVATAGIYALAFRSSGAPASGSRFAVHAVLQMRQV